MESVLIKHLRLRLAETRQFDRIVIKSESRTATPAHSQKRADAIVEMRRGKQRIILLVEVKRYGYPRDLHQAVRHLESAKNNLPKNMRASLIVPLVLAESISPGARILLREQGVGYCDQGGSLYISAPGLLLWLDRPAPKFGERRIRSLFSGRRAQVLIGLMRHRQEWINVAGLAKIAHVSTATASETLSELEKYEWVDVRGRGPSKERYLRDPAGLLDAWAIAPRLARYTQSRWYRYSATTDSVIREMAHQLDEFGIDYALTMECGANLLAPYLTAMSQLHIVISPSRSPESVAEQLNLKPATEGANVLLLQSRSQAALLFREKVNEVFVADPVLVYLDLIGASGRSKEAADHLRRERIGF